MSQIPNFLRSMVEKNPFANDGTNFSSWILKLKIILRLENLSFVREQDDPVFVDEANPTQEELADKSYWEEQSVVVQSLMLSTMGDQLQRKFFDTPAKEIIAQLEKMFTDSVSKERYRTTIALTRCKMLEGESVSMHFLKVQEYLKKFEKLKAPMPADIAEDIILGSLPASYKDFVMHYHVRENK